jgi:peptide deformylase
LTILEVVYYPDPVLRTCCSAVEKFDNELESIVKDMIETMYSYHGTSGLAAPQVNICKRIVIIDVNAKTTKDKLLVLINPEILEASKKKYVREGCLSLPEYLADIKRAQKVTVKAQDIKGNYYEYNATNFEAVAIQHETDHLDGILFIDKVDCLKTGSIRRRASEFMDEKEIQKGA